MKCFSSIGEVAYARASDRRIKPSAPPRWPFGGLEGDRIATPPTPVGPCRGAGMNRHMSGLQRGESLGADIARQHGFGPQLRDSLGCLDSGALRRVEVLHVVMCSKLARCGVDQQEIPGTPEPRIDGAVQVTTLSSNNYFHGVSSVVRPPPRRRRRLRACRLFRQQPGMANRSFSSVPSRNARTTSSTSPQTSGITRIPLAARRASSGHEIAPQTSTFDSQFGEPSRPVVWCRATEALRMPVAVVLAVEVNQQDLLSDVEHRRNPALPVWYGDFHGCSLFSVIRRRRDPVSIERLVRCLYRGGASQTSPLSTPDLQSDASARPERPRNTRPAPSKRRFPARASWQERRAAPYAPGGHDAGIAAPRAGVDGRPAGEAGRAQSHPRRPRRHRHVPAPRNRVPATGSVSRNTKTPQQPAARPVIGPNPIGTSSFPPGIVFGLLSEESCSTSGHRCSALGAGFLVAGLAGSMRLLVAALRAHASAARASGKRPTHPALPLSTPLWRAGSIASWHRRAPFLFLAKKDSADRLSRQAPLP